MLSGRKRRGNSTLDRQILFHISLAAALIPRKLNLPASGRVSANSSVYTITIVPRLDPPAHVPPHAVLQAWILLCFYSHGVYSETSSISALASGVKERRSLRLAVRNLPHGERDLRCEQAWTRTRFHQNQNLSGLMQLKTAPSLGSESRNSTYTITIHLSHLVAPMELS